MKRGTAIHQELDWLVPGTILTLLSGAFALFETPNPGTLLPELLLLPFWLIAAFGLAAVVTLVAIFRMMREGIEHPVTHCVSYLHDNRKLLLLVAFGMVLTGLNMIAFMWVKPLLNYLIPFRADPLLASVDRFIFGTDPWRLLVYLNTTPLAIFYHRGWFALMIITLLVLLMQPASAQKSAVMLTYFLLWSVFGPVVHTLCPAGGPVFYAALGYGNSFSALAMEEAPRGRAGSGAVPVALLFGSNLRPWCRHIGDAVTAHCHHGLDGHRRQPICEKMDTADDGGSNPHLFALCQSGMALRRRRHGRVCGGLCQLEDFVDGHRETSAVDADYGARELVGDL